ncbi:MAG: Sec-dependent nitrous-oxide reductase [Bacteroidia bacterium]|jgi:nitrous-oxide reductase|nr:Sec-dependent nitrous-oxide reductase [Bacteroidia bacterium]MBP7268949.1 Sec-dependent nitrous-oxide reductase [Bacteroidia bacterium]MBP7436492.1 Sec-dependent nitrous-oxide reductase [Bacteroidia bacterium]MBP7772158.1 Sec-dependent nitrous-oxide reductase [Bacteroidia bacterium]
MKFNRWPVVLLALFALALMSCGGPKEKKSVAAGDAPSKVYVAPGKLDEYYEFMSGGFSGQVGVYGLPSCRLLKVIPVFAVNAENGYGFTEESKAMLNSTHGFVPWDDSHHPELSKTNGETDGRWLFINSNNTPRVARIDLSTFRTVEMLEIPNSGGNHASPFATENTEYVVAATRFSVPITGNKDVPISTYKENFQGSISFIKVAPEGDMSIAFQILMPGFDFDLSHCGRGPSEGWFFFSCYNTERAHTLLEANASQNDKDFMVALNWKKAEEYAKAGKGKEMNSAYYHNKLDEKTHTVKSEILNKTIMLDPKECTDMVYLMPCPKSPHGADVDPSGEYIVGGGKLATVIPVFAFSKIQKAIANKAYAGEVDGIPVLKYEEVIGGEVQKPGLGPLHTEFDGKGFAYTSHFVSSEVVKWKLGTWEVVDRIPTYYSIGHLSIPGGDTKSPSPKYLIAMNKITKDRYLLTGPELNQSAQLIDLTGDKMKILYDFPTVGEPHYAQGIEADKVMKRQVKVFKLEDNQHPYVAKSEKESRVERKGKAVHVYMTSIRSHFAPDNIEGVFVGDTVYFHVTNLEQDWDTPHGFAIKGSTSSESLIMPGETQTIKFVAKTPDIYPYYCTDFCSALHQEMQGYLRVSSPGSNVPLTYSTGK